MRFRFGLKFISVLVLVGALAACEDSESRAERYYQSGLALLEEGDVERALIEFRNVFNLNGAHREARSTYARLIREQGKINEAFGQYKRLVEQYPDDLEGRIALSEMSFFTQQWEEFDRHAKAAVENAPDDPRVQAIEATALFRNAMIEEDGPARDVALEKVIALIAEQPENQLLQQTEINGHLANQNYAKALEAIDRAIESDPESIQLARFRLSVLNALEDTEGMEAQLRQMIKTFPEDEQSKRNLLALYSQNNELEKAESFLREVADPDAEEPGFYIALLQLIRQERGVESLVAELDAVIPTVEDPSRYQAMRAGVIFGQGQQTEAIEALEAVIAATEPSDQQREIKISLAGMLLQTGNEVGARQLVEQVLAEDPSQVAALRMTAKWQMEADDVSGAITSLRTALDQAPEDVMAMRLMADAYLRDGNRDLARDFLSLAVDASNQAPQQTLEYAIFLIQEERYLLAERALVTSLRKEQNKNNVQLLSLLGETYRLMKDDARLDQLIDQLAAVGTQTAIENADRLRAALIERQEGTEAAIAYFDEASKEWDNSLQAKATVLRGLVARGDVEGALESASNALAEDPDNPALRYMMAATQAAAGQLNAAESTYRALVAENPQAANIWLQLVRVLTAKGDSEAASEALAEGLEANPEASTLLRTRVEMLTQAGEVDEAIAVYRTVLQDNPARPDLWVLLAGLLNAQGDVDAGQQALVEGIEANPSALVLYWVRASHLEEVGDIEGAIEIYEAMYEINSNDLIIANNLASMLATYRDDEESLDRAAIVARRLRGMDQVAFRDTWGWIAFRQGDVEEALGYLEPAAAGLPDDPQVQYHLGRVYETMSRKTDAKLQYEKALELADPDDTRASIADARTRLEALNAE